MCSDSHCAPGMVWSVLLSNFTTGKISLKNCSSGDSILTKYRINPTGEPGTWSPFPPPPFTPGRQRSPCTWPFWLQLPASTSAALKYQVGVEDSSHGHLTLWETSGLLQGHSEISNFFCLRLSLRTHCFLSYGSIVRGTKEF